MISWLNSTVTIGPFVGTGILLVLSIGSVFVVWSLWAVLFPEAWISVPLSKPFGFVLMALRMAARFFTVRPPEQLKSWVTLVLVRTFFHRKLDLHLWQQVGFDLM